MKLRLVPRQRYILALHRASSFSQVQHSARWLDTATALPPLRP